MPPSKSSRLGIHPNVLSSLPQKELHRLQALLSAQPQDQDSDQNNNNNESITSFNRMMTSATSTTTITTNTTAIINNTPFPTILPLVTISSILSYLPLTSLVQIRTLSVECFNLFINTEQPNTSSVDGDLRDHDRDQVLFRSPHFTIDLLQRSLEIITLLSAHTISLSPATQNTTAPHPLITLLQVTRQFDNPLSNIIKLLRLALSTFPGGVRGAQFGGSEGLIHPFRMCPVCDQRSLGMFLPTREESDDSGDSDDDNNGGGRGRWGYETDSDASSDENEDEDEGNDENSMTGAKNNPNTAPTFIMPNMQSLLLNSLDPHFTFLEIYKVYKQKLVEKGLMKNEENARALLDSFLSPKSKSHPHPNATLKASSSSSSSKEAPDSVSSEQPEVHNLHSMQVLSCQESLGGCGNFCITAACGRCKGCGDFDNETSDEGEEEEEDVDESDFSDDVESESDDGRLKKKIKNDDNDQSIYEYLEKVRKLVASESGDNNEEEEVVGDLVVDDLEKSNNTDAIPNPDDDVDNVDDDINDRVRASQAKKSRFITANEYDEYHPPPSAPGPYYIRTRCCRLGKLPYPPSYTNANISNNSNNSNDDNNENELGEYDDFDDDGGRENNEETHDNCCTRFVHCKHHCSRCQHCKVEVCGSWCLEQCGVRLVCFSCEKMINGDRRRNDGDEESDEGEGDDVWGSSGGDGEDDESDEDGSDDDGSEEEETTESNRSRKTKKISKSRRYNDDDDDDDEGEAEFDDEEPKERIKSSKSREYDDDDDDEGEAEFEG